MRTYTAQTLNKMEIIFDLDKVVAAEEVKMFISGQITKESSTRVYLDTQIFTITTPYDIFKDYWTHHL